MDGVDSQITVHMPGGKIEIKIAEDFAVSMTGTVTRVAEGVFYPEMLGSTEIFLASSLVSDR
jgi:diaminopimelate epimerase